MHNGPFSIASVDEQNAAPVGNYWELSNTAIN